MSEPTFIYPPPSPVTIGGLDAVQQANASDRTAPRRTVVVERALLVGLLDAWQQYWEGYDTHEEYGGPPYIALKAAMDELGEAIA